MSEQPRSVFWRWAWTAVLFAMSALLLARLPPDPSIRVWNIALGIFAAAAAAWTVVANLREQ